MPPLHATVRALLRELTALRERMLDLESEVLRSFPRLHPVHRRSAANLSHYVALRSREVRAVQERLVRLGVSSLGRAEGHVLGNLDAVLDAVSALGRVDPTPRRPSSAPVAAMRGRRILERRAETLLGKPAAGRTVRILVTLPTEAAEDPDVVRRLVASGMDCARINCAHDGPEEWAAMIRHLGRAERAAGRRLRVLMDLAGPKIRTGPLPPGPPVVRWHPRRDEWGRVVEPARIWLTPADAPQPPPGPCQATLPVAAEWLSRRANGDGVAFVDTRGALRTIRVNGSVGTGRWAVSAQTSYVSTGTRLEAGGSGSGDTASVGTLPPADVPLVLHRDELLVVTRSCDPGAPPTIDASGLVASPARIGCTLPEALRHVRPGHAVWFDDGRIGGVVEEADRDEVRVRIRHARAGGERLRPDKGVNLPDTAIDVPCLTAADLDALDFVVAHADAVALSFVRTRADVEELQSRLAERGGSGLGVVLKVETREAFARVPELILAAMRSARVGVMIARGDLAVECGFERLAEAQEEILWFCEAAHVPAIWATQVLDTMARDGVPTRAEITDAAMGERAECVMLNKGPHVAEAASTLDSILRRMGDHQRKKSALLRRLSVAVRFARDHSAARRAASPDRAAPRAASRRVHAIPPTN